MLAKQTDLSPGGVSKHVQAILNPHSQVKGLGPDFTELGVFNFKINQLQLLLKIRMPHPAILRLSIQADATHLHRGPR